MIIRAVDSLTLKVAERDFWCKERHSYALLGVSVRKPSGDPVLLSGLASSRDAGGIACPELVSASRTRRSVRSYGGVRVLR